MNYEEKCKIISDNQNNPNVCVEIIETMTNTEMERYFNENNKSIIIKSMEDILSSCIELDNMSMEEYAHSHNLTSYEDFKNNVLNKY